MQMVCENDILKDKNFLFLQLPKSWRMLNALNDRNNNNNNENDDDG